MIRIVIFLTSALSLLSICTCGQGSADAVEDRGTDERMVTVMQLHDIVESGTDVFLLDVRTLEEFQLSRLGFADIRIPFDSLLGNLDRLPENKETVLYCFCRSGRRSHLAAKTLREAGFLNAIDVSGGLIAWQKAGYETVSGSE